ncbi:MAG TPA: DUF3168 domain-containing protein [Jiangellales bacterium]|nr:DUF3168 domain-containing protein [Jiangellales bacterium]
MQAHANAVLGLLRATPNLTVYPAPDSVEQVPDGALPPYVSVYISTRYVLGPTLEMASARAVTTVTCHCAGGNAIAARAVAQLVSSALLDVVPTIAGRTCFPIRQEPTDSTPRPDESTNRLVMDLIAQYRLETLPG